MLSTRLRGARTHNLKGVDLELEPGMLIVVAGPSGAGKSSLALDTLYAEGQRRYVESFSTYARQFLERMARPAVDELDPVPAAVAVDRRPPAKTSRSTVGTMTEMSDYAKELWARASTLHCPGCDRTVVRDTAESAAEQILREYPARKLVVTFRCTFESPESFLGVRESLVADGYHRIWRDGELVELDQLPPSALLLGDGPHGMHVVADRLVSHQTSRSRLVEALEAGFRKGHGHVTVHVIEGDDLRFSEALHCPYCDRSFSDPSPGLFSFNSPIGACESCRGFGRTIEVDWNKVIPDKRKTLGGGAIRAWTGKATEWERRTLLKHCQKAGVPLDVAYRDLTDEQKRWVIEGDDIGWPRGWSGLRGWFKWLESKAYKMHVRVFLARYRTYETCADCHGVRLKPQALQWRVQGTHIGAFLSMSVRDALSFLRALQPSTHDNPPVALLVQECIARLSFLEHVGLEYLTLDRPSRTLSGGEAQRVALASALGASLTGALVVLDEPTVGLHPSDVQKLIDVLQKLKTSHNTVVVVEHDASVIGAADRVIELGPGPAELGGSIVYDGAARGLPQASTLTGKALSRTIDLRRKKKHMPPAKGWIELRGASGHNLRSVDVNIPIGRLTCVTGVSGSGKSSLILETLVPAVARGLGETPSQPPLPHDSLHGHTKLHSVVAVDQSAMGRTSRGNAATYLKIWDAIRLRFAEEPLAKERKWGPGYFSFNVAGGRCDACKGEGSETVEMQFLADVTFTCPVCQGRRFSDETLEVRHRGHSVADFLTMSADRAAEVLRDDLDIVTRLQPLRAVGLGYLQLGQSLSMLSGGEAQRLKLAYALSQTAPGSLIVLDEPTAGLHTADMVPLLRVLDELVTRGDTVVVIEHDMGIAAQADYVIDVGPGPGSEGGHIVAEGRPEELVRARGAHPTSRTLPYLRAELEKQPWTAAASVPKTRSKRSTSTAYDIPPLQIRGAREHNLQHVSVDLPREKFVVVTGPSGSGKSTLTFDVVFAEGQRRYMETLSPYARQYLPQLPRPEVDQVIGVPPSVSLEQRVTRGGSNSTVATLTEVAHYLRLLFSKVGVLYCPNDGTPISAASPDSLAASVRSRFTKRDTLRILAPVVRGRKGGHVELLSKFRKQGYVYGRIDGRWVTLGSDLKLDRYKEHTVEIQVAELHASSDALDDAVRKAVQLGEGNLSVCSTKDELYLSIRRSCPRCNTGYPELDPRFFSFNTPQGACETCAGLGYVLTNAASKSKPTSTVPPSDEREPCPSCQGTRLSILARAVRVDEYSIDQLLGLGVHRAKAAIQGLTLQGRERLLGEHLQQEIVKRLSFLQSVGLGYLELQRPAWSLSGGEVQRVRLAGQLGSGLTGILYVLDEPTIGLHPRDTSLLIDAIRALTNQGCSLLVVEHDADTIRAADHVVDMGPSGGRRGGQILAQGAPDQLLRDPHSITGASLAQPATLRNNDTAAEPQHWIELRGAREHNLKDVHLRVPVGQLVVVTGVSGSGKSTLVRSVFLPAVRQALGLQSVEPGRFDQLVGVEHIKRAVQVDQSPIGRTPRSVPATYIGVWDEIRKLLATTPEARARGYTASRFSFNAKEGRCAVCAGQGAITVEMSFLPDVLVACEACGGNRFSPETLQVQYANLHAGEILDLEMTDAARVFSAVPKVVRPIQLLCDLGLGYLKLGQASNTLSGGEAQRLKLVAELSTGGSAGPTLYVLDEPTTGLHRTDVERLLGVFLKFVQRGDTVVIIEHHPDVMLAADWLIDLGPEGGDEGGHIVAEGTPRELIKSARTYTADALRQELQRHAPAKRKSTGKRHLTEVRARAQ
jgi:excinuclease ABC subunit A